MVHISPDQCRAARAMLGWSQSDLSEAAGVNKRTVMDFESGNREPHAGTLTLIVQAYSAAGIEFIPENGGGAGVRWRERKAKRENSDG